MCNNNVHSHSQFPPQNKNPFALNNNNNKIISSSGNNRHPEPNNLTNYKGLSSAFSNIGGDNNNNKTNNNSSIGITNGNNQNPNHYNNNNPYTNTEYEKSMITNNFQQQQQQLLNNNNINKNSLVPGGMGNMSFYIPQQGNNLPLFDSNNNISSLTANGNINVSGMNNTTMDQLRLQQQQQTSAINNGLVGTMSTNLQPGINIAGRAIGNMGSNNTQQQIVDNNYKRLL